MPSHFSLIRISIPEHQNAAAINNFKKNLDRTYFCDKVGRIANRYVVSIYLHNTFAGEISYTLAPKEQPPRKLSGKRTTNAISSGERFLILEPADGIMLSGIRDRGGAKQAFSAEIKACCS